MTTHSNRLVADYLRQLERASASLPRARRTELLAEIREHIDDALLEAGAADEVGVRNVLERLGTPEEIVAAAAPPDGAPTGHTGKLETVALVTLAIPVVGWLVGIPLVLVSRAWAGRDKAIAVVLGLSPLLLGGLVLMDGGGSERGVTVGTAEPPAPGSSGVPVDTPEQPSTGNAIGPLEVAVLSTAFLGGLIGSAFLALRLLRAGRPRALEA